MIHQHQLARRGVLKGMAAVASATLMSRVLAAESAAAAAPSRGRSIDREALVSRHRVVRHESDLELPIQVGNGRFAFGADVTGLQTFLAFNTLADWGWHEDALPAGKQISDLKGRVWDTYGRDVAYWTHDEGEPEIFNWLRENPHRANLGRIGLRMLKADGTEAVEADLTDVEQVLDPWTGLLRSRFRLEGHQVKVETACHPGQDAIGVRIDSDLVRAGRLTAFIDFPYAMTTGTQKFSAPFVGFWDRPERHTTTVTRRGRTARVTHTMDDTVYQVGLDLPGGAEITRLDPALHRYQIVGRGNRLELTALFAPEVDKVPSARDVVDASEEWWPRFWRTGGAVDLSRSTDPRWRELERRIVLSQYHLAVNDAGNDPAQESGLVNNGWYGKFHMEMYWWHAFHYGLWNRWSLLDRSTDIYERFLPHARELAVSQGFRGARWPKMTTAFGDAIGRESPGTPTCLLIWQQPHPLFLAEMDYQAHPQRSTLRKWETVVRETAEFMASFANREEETGRYVIGPPIMCCNERNKPESTLNPTFELSYWKFGLRIAQQWRQRLGWARDEALDEILDNLAPLPVEDGTYVLYEGVPNMWTERNTNHPDPIAPFGMLPGDGVDLETMRATTRRVYETWPVTDLYSWDFPLLAMNAARLGDPVSAVDNLLHERLGFTDTGLPASGKSGVPSPYFPSAGGLLYSVAMMCAGWADSPEGVRGATGTPGPRGSAPGFPTDGWTVVWEDLSPAL